MTQEERWRELLRRMKKSKSQHPTVQRQIKALEKKLRDLKKAKGGAPVKKQKAPRDAKQEIYRIRHEAKKAGLPLPALPK